MKICLVEDFYRPYSSGGASEYVARLADALATSGHEVFVITTRPGAATGYAMEQQGSVTVFRVQTNLANIPVYTNAISVLGRIPSILWYWFNPWVYRDVQRILKKVQPDVVHTFDTLYLSLSALVAARRSGILWVHSLLYVNLIKPTGIIWRQRSGSRIGLWKFLLPLTKQIVKSPAMIITPSRFSLAIHQQYGFFRHVRSALIPLGPMHEISFYQRTHALPRRFLSVGRMSTEKGTLKIVQAFQAYRNQNVRLTIVGRGPDEKAIRALAASDNRIEVHPHLSSEELGRIFSASDVYISASQALETFNLTISEAFRAGMPVITTDLGAQPELVTTSCGLLYSPDDEMALTRAIQRYAEEPGLWSTHAVQAFERSHYFSFETNVIETVRLYQRMMETNE